MEGVWDVNGLYECAIGEVGLWKGLVGTARLLGGAGRGCKAFWWLAGAASHAFRGFQMNMITD